MLNDVCFRRGGVERADLWKELQPSVMGHHAALYSCTSSVHSVLGSSTHWHVHALVQACTCAFVHVCACVCMRARAYTCVYSCTNMCLRAHQRRVTRCPRGACPRTCVRVCVCVHNCVPACAPASGDQVPTGSVPTCVRVCVCV